MAGKLPPTPIGVPPGSSFWNDWYEKLRYLVNNTADIYQTKLNNSAGLAAALSDETGTGLAVFNTSPTLVTPALGTPASGVATNLTGTAAGLTAGHVTTNANLTGPITSVGNATSIASQTGTGTKFVVDTSPTLVTPLLGTPTSGNLVNCTGYPIASVANLASGVATFLTTPSSANLISAVTDESGSGALVFANTPTLVTPVLGVATATSVNKYTFTAPATTATLTILNNKTFTVNKTLTLDGTDSTTMTFPSTNATIARTDALQTFAGVQTFSSTIVGSINGNAATVTTNANLTGPITSSGNATSIASQTGTGTTFAMSAGPTFTGTTTTAAISATTVSASGAISSIMGNNTNIFASIQATTGYQYMRIANTSGGLVWGVDNSTGGGLIIGSTGYDACIYAISGISFSADNGATLHARLSSSGLYATALTANTGFGCNSKTAQTAYASGGSVVTTASTNVAPYGYTTAAQADAIITLLNNIRAALVANGIMS